MQKEEPLIHILYFQLKTLILILLSNFIKQSTLESISFEVDSIKKLLENSDNFLNLLEIKIGERANKTLAILPKQLQLSFMNQVKNFYVANVKHILGKVKNPNTLKYFQCLAPDNIKKSESVGYIIKISKLLPLINIDNNKLEYEWRLLQQDEKVRFFLNKNERIDFWLRLRLEQYL